MGSGNPSFDDFEDWVHANHGNTYDAFADSVGPEATDQSMRDGFDP